MREAFPLDTTSLPLISALILMFSDFDIRISDFL
jgi:hypothetical protein